MKYLKKFEAIQRKPDNNIERDKSVKEICFDLTDNGFNIFTYDRRGSGSNAKLTGIKDFVLLSIKKDIHDPKTQPYYFHWDDVKEVCFRLIEYLGDDFISLTYFTKDADKKKIYTHNKEVIKVKIPDLIISELDEGTIIEDELFTVDIKYKLIE